MSGAGSGSQLSTEELTLTCLAPLPLELQLIQLEETDLVFIILKIRTCVKQKFRSFTFPIELKYHIEQCQSLTFRVSILWWSEIA